MDRTAILIGLIFIVLVGTAYAYALNHGAEIYSDNLRGRRMLADDWDDGTPTSWFETLGLLALLVVLTPVFILLALLCLDEREPELFEGDAEQRHNRESR